MKVSVIVPVYRGEAFIAPLLEAIAAQSETVAELWLIETDPGGEVERLAEQHGVHHRGVAAADFDHAGTRTWAAQQATGDVLLFLTQDVMPTGEHTFRALLAPLADRPAVGAVYGRQVPKAGAHPFAAIKRSFNYPDESMTKGLEDAKRLGLRTVFISNAFAAYRRQALAEVGWFPERQIMCEDITAAARLLSAGHHIHYAADAAVWHTHELSWSTEMRRYFDIGAAHRQQDWIRRRFGHPNQDGLRYLSLGLRRLREHGHSGRIPGFVLRCAFGKLVYSLGHHHRLLPTSWCAHLSSFPRWWRHPSGARTPAAPPPTSFIPRDPR